MGSLTQVISCWGQGTGIQVEAPRTYLLPFHVAASQGKIEPWSTRGSITPVRKLWREARTSTIRSLSADPGIVPGPGFSWALSKCPRLGHTLSWYFPQEVITKLPWACSCRGPSCSQNCRAWIGLIRDWHRVGARWAFRRRDSWDPSTGCMVIA